MPLFSGVRSYVLGSLTLRGYGRYERNRAATPITSCLMNMTMASDFLRQMHARMLMIFPEYIEDYGLNHTIDDSGGSHAFTRLREEFRRNNA